MGLLDMELLEDAIKEISLARQKIDKSPAGFVISLRVLDYLKDQAIYQRNQPNDQNKLYGVPVYAFADIPDDSLVVFKDKDKLDKYLDKRMEGVSHVLAMAWIASIPTFGSDNSDFICP